MKVNEGSGHILKSYRMWHLESDIVYMVKAFSTLSPSHLVQVHHPTMATYAQLSSSSVHILPHIGWFLNGNHNLVPTTTTITTATNPTTNNITSTTATDTSSTSPSSTHNTSITNSNHHPIQSLSIVHMAFEVVSISSTVLIVFFRRGYSYFSLYGYFIHPLLGMS